jgi:hypothetical protein
LCEAAAQGVRLHEVDECLLPVDLDDREQLAVPGFELGITVDQHFLELEVELVTERRDGLARTVAEVAPLRAVQRDLCYG